MIIKCFILKTAQESCSWLVTNALQKIELSRFSLTDIRKVHTIGADDGLTLMSRNVLRVCIGARPLRRRVECKVQPMCEMKKVSSTNHIECQYNEMFGVALVAPNFFLF